MGRDDIDHSIVKAIDVEGALKNINGKGGFGC